MLDSRPPRPRYGLYRAIKRLSGTSGNGRALHCRGQMRGEDNAGIVVMGHPCRDLRGWRRLFPGSRDALGLQLTERERPEPENRPGFFLFAETRDRGLAPAKAGFTPARRVLLFPGLVLSI